MNDKFAFFLVKHFCLNCPNYRVCKVSKNIDQRRYWIELIRKSHRLEHPDGTLPKVYSPSLVIPKILEKESVEIGWVTPVEHKGTIHFVLSHMLMPDYLKL